MPLKFEIKSKEAQEEEDFRNALINRDYTKKFFREISSGTIKNMSEVSKDGT
ncbi:hypothetical protein MBAV_003325 [Candidatus Magnetobacterium bavaricum]|uniref:Uncharacterized protein n=1 Tax=Candidatus Magnetobacterium bavaricum TaxID=29290 RepID=A0A0F3GR95_9BACT|nr:hypothetical protein MBAV_003325 [Candidatus Magnetobacterium bavaricum]